MQEDIKLSKHMTMTEQPEYDLVNETRQRVTEQLREDKVKIREMKENMTEKLKEDRLKA